MLRRPAACALVAAVVATACAGGKPSPAVALPTAGTPTTLRAALVQERGEPVVVNYWATWCIPCRNEMPRLVAAAKRYAGRVDFLGVNVEDDPRSAAAFAERFKMPFRSLSDADGRIRRDQKLLGLPATQFYSSDGQLAFLHQGEISREELDRRIGDLLAG